MSNGGENFTKTVPQLPLNDGFDIPLLGLASFRVDPDAKLREVLLANLDAGIRHVEVSELFGNGHVVVDCVTEGNAELLREEVFFTMKIWPKERKKQELVDATKETLVACGLDYVDLIIIHGPLDIENRLDQYKAIEQLKAEGFARSIGVANMTYSQLSNILKKATVVPAVVEMEITPFHQRGDIAEFCIDNGIIILNDNPLAKNVYSTRPDLVELAASLNLTVQQMLVRWGVSKGFAILLPSADECVGYDLELLSQPLAIDVVELLDTMDEGMLTAWETNEEMNGDDR